MKRMVFYPDCRWLDPNTRDAKGHFYCEFRCRYVKPALTVYKHHRGHRIFQDDRCAPNCWHRDGKTRVPTL